MINEIFKVLFYQPIFNFIVYAYHLTGDNLGWAMIAVALVSRLIMYPFTAKQLENAQKAQDMKKEYDKIKKQYAKNKEKQSEEMAKLQAKHLPGQLSGCLPLIFQLIFFIQIRNVIMELFTKGTSAFNEVAYPFVAKFAEGAAMNFNFFGIDLSKTANNIGITNVSSVWPYILLALAVGISQFASTWVLTGIKEISDKKKKQTEEKKEKPKKKKDEDAAPDFSDMMQNSGKQMLYILPVMTVFFSLNFVAGLSLYWTVQSMFVIIQQLIRERKKVAEWVREKLNKQATSEIPV